MIQGLIIVSEETSNNFACVEIAVNASTVRIHYQTSNGTTQIARITNQGPVAQSPTIADTTHALLYLQEWLSQQS